MTENDIRILDDAIRSVAIMTLAAALMSSYTTDDTSHTQCVDEAVELMRYLRFGERKP